MPQSIRHTLAAAGFAALLLGGTAVSAVVLSPGVALAQEDQAPKQVKVSQKQIDDLIAAQPELSALQPGGGGGDDAPNPKVQKKMEKVVKAHGFSSLDEYGEVSDSIGLVLAGLDPDTKKYVGATELIKKQMAQVKADKGMKPREKSEAMKQLKEAMDQGDGPKPLDENIDIVIKNYDKLAPLMQGGEGQ